MRQMIAVIALLGLSACGGVAARSDADVQQAIEAAQAAAHKADAVGSEWRDTGEMIKKARQAAAQGDQAKAMKLAKEAEKQGELGYQQYLDQKNAGPHY